MTADTQEPQTDQAVETLTINFVEDGLTVLGRVRYRGEELSVDRGSEEWEKVKGWIELTEPQQEAKWGKRMFRPGTWTGAAYDLNDPELTPEQQRELARVNAERFGERSALADLPGNTENVTATAGKVKRGPGRPRKSSTTEE